MKFSFSLFRNLKKPAGSKQPDYWTPLQPKNPLIINGVEYKVVAWQERTKSGEVYLSMAMEPVAATGQAGRDNQSRQGDQGHHAGQGYQAERRQYGQQGTGGRASAAPASPGGFTPAQTNTYRPATLPPVEEDLPF